MRVRVKQIADSGMKKIDSTSNIDNIVMEENLLSPEGEQVSIFFKGRDSSGILSLTTSEFESLTKTIKPNLHMVKRQELRSKSTKKEPRKKSRKIKKKTTIKRKSKKPRKTKRRK